MDGFYFVFVSPNSGHLKKYLPDDHKKVYSSHSLKWRFGVKPSNVGPASRSELEHSSFNFSSGGMDVPVRGEWFHWKSKEIRKGKKKKTNTTRKTAWTILQQMLRMKRFLYSWTISATVVSLCTGEVVHSTGIQRWQAQRRGQVTAEPGETLICELLTKEAKGIKHNHLEPCQEEGGCQQGYDSHPLLLSQVRVF